MQIRPALEQGDLGRVEELLVDCLPPPPAKNWWLLGTLAARLEAHVALGDRQRVEEEAVPLLRPGTYLEPFALRALGVIREDDQLIEQATRRFDALELEWHAARTRDAPAR